MEISEIYKLPTIERSKLFFEVAGRVGLVKEGHYISGIPKGVDKDVRLFYILEDILEYPKPQKVK